jgi:endothelin-converting enzyme/putative endopeptidase
LAIWLGFPVVLPGSLDNAFLRKRMRLSRIAFLLVSGFLIPFSFAQDQPQMSHQPVLDVSSMDKSVDPCVDFFAYSCGGWIRKNPIPPDQSSWSVSGKLQDDNQVQLREHP